MIIFDTPRLDSHGIVPWWSTGGPNPGQPCQLESSTEKLCSGGLVCVVYSGTDSLMLCV